MMTKKNHTDQRVADLMNDPRVIGAHERAVAQAMEFVNARACRGTQP